ncbi:MAG TPA: S-adenosylmethionine decarboxylase [Solirubrobacteraceae bacterium]|jgi:S-adenosylmethionine/arginine decarboxylase-like enzyme|nr:S-adenosylmethionine decarboxylase [Solirubrobacteraceae bacterium]
MTYKRVLHDGVVHYGQQILLDATGCSAALRDIEVVGAFLEAMPGRVGMRTYGAPVVVRFGDGDDIGISGVQLLYTSAVVLHTNDMYGDLYLDLFSCAAFAPDVVVAEVERWFEPETHVHRVIYRR